MYLFILTLFFSVSFAFADSNIIRPGLYKISRMESQLSDDSTNVTHSIDSETGDLTVTYQSRGKLETKKFPGQGSQQICIKTNSDGAMDMPKGACVGKPGVRTGNTIVSSADCQGMSMVTTLTKLHEDVFQRTVKVEMKSAGRTTNSSYMMIRVGDCK